MKINIDIDDTVNNFIEKFVEYFNMITGRNLTVAEVTDYNLSRFTGVPNKALETLFFNNNYFYKMLTPLSGAVDIIEEIAIEHEVKFVTAIKYEAIQERINFLNTYFPFIDIDRALLVTNDKHSIYADIVIDDCLNNLTNINEECKFIVFKQAWNANAQYDNNVLALTNNWSTIKAVIDRYDIYLHSF